MARRGRCAPARSTAKSPTAFAANGAPRSTPISDPSSKPHGEDRSEPSTPSPSPSRAAPCLAQLENVNGDLSNYLKACSTDFAHLQKQFRRAPLTQVQCSRSNRAAGYGQKRPKCGRKPAKLASSPCPLPQEPRYS